MSASLYKATLISVRRDIPFSRRFCQCPQEIHHRYQTTEPATGSRSPGARAAEPLAETL